MIGGCTLRKAIGIAGRDVESIQHPQPILQIGHVAGQRGSHPSRQVLEGASKAVAPDLLAMVQVQGLERFFCCLVTGKAGPFMVTCIGAELGLSQISLRLMQPVGRTVHGSILKMGSNA